MTVQPGTAPPQPPQYTPPAGSRIEQLLDDLETARARVKDAESAVRSIRAGITNELTALYPQVPEVGIAAGRNRPAYRMHWVTPRKFDKDRFEKEQPAAYASYLAWGTPHWRIDKAGG